MKKFIFALFLIVFFVLTFGIAHARTRDFNHAAGWVLNDASNTVTLQDANDVVHLEEANVYDIGEAHLDSIYSDGNITIPIGDPISVTGKITGSAGLHITADANIVGNLSTTEGITTSSYKNALYYGAAYTDATLQDAITALSTNHWTLVVDRGT
ncbi:MAG TPA: hypothetical protein VMV77_07240, partial [Bacteroidales bacterium]|nr:hypothetical protein [Bacteroidales bacterium]